MAKKQSKALTRFYKAYAKWLEANAPEQQGKGNKHGFSRGSGLCGNLLCCMTVKSKYGTVLDEMVQQFKDAGHEESYPFGGHRAYERGARDYTQHLNGKRIRWVYAHAG